MSSSSTISCCPTPSSLPLPCPIEGAFPELEYNDSAQSCNTAGAYFWAEGVFTAIVSVPAPQDLPIRLQQITCSPQLTISMLVNSSLDAGKLQKNLAVEAAEQCIAFNLQVVARLLHVSEPTCSCDAQDDKLADSRIQDVLSSLQIQIPETLWHAGLTVYGRAHYLMMLVEEFINASSVPWSDVVERLVGDEAAVKAHRCIIDSVQRTGHEPRIVLGDWAASILMPSLIRPNEEEGHSTKTATEENSHEQVLETTSQRVVSDGEPKRLPKDMCKGISPVEHRGTGGAPESICGVSTEVSQALRYSQRQANHGEKPDYTVRFDGMADVDGTVETSCPRSRKRKRSQTKLSSARENKTKQTRIEPELINLTVDDY